MTGAAYAGTGTWQAVMAAAGGRCECTGGCGRTHASGGGRCPRESLPGDPLRAVPRTHVPDVAAAYLSAVDLTALYAPCAEGIGRRECSPGAATPSPPYSDHRRCSTHDATGNPGARDRRRR
jgi:hypothetical protein